MILRTVRDVSMLILRCPMSQLYMDHARKLKNSSYVHLPSINKCFNFVTLEGFCEV